MEAIHGSDIYEGFDASVIPTDVRGWGGDSGAFAKLIQSAKPRLIIEVGTWKGASALTMAKEMDEAGVDGEILCIDTWLGALEFWEDHKDPERFVAMECRHGYPQVYFRFLANVCHHGQTRRIVPFPLPACTAALWLMRRGVRAGLIYLDGSHEEEDVYQDLLDYHGLLEPGGMIFGDDWSWSGVRAAVERFAAEEQLIIRHVEDKWVLGGKA